jgi:hypothetical protein
MSTAFNDPTHAKLIKIWHEMEVPGFVKEAASVAEQDFNVVDVQHFADPANRLYPVNTKSNAWLSREHFRRDKGTLEKQAAEIIEKRILKAAEFWGLDEPIRIREEPNKHTIHCIEIEDDVDKQIIKMDVTGHFKEAAERFCANRANFTYSMRRSFARGMLSAPADVKEPLDVDTEQMLCKMANYGSCTPETARDAVFLRMCLVRRKDPETFGQLVKVAQSLQNMEGLMNIDVLHKVARLLDYVDRSHGLHVRYGRDINPPEDDLFHFTEKKASAVRDEALILSDGTILNRIELLHERDKADEYFEKIAGKPAPEDDDGFIETVLHIPADEVPTLLNFMEA